MRNPAGVLEVAEGGATLLCHRYAVPLNILARVHGFRGLAPTATVVTALRACGGGAWGVKFAVNGNELGAIQNGFFKRRLALD